jgi:uncharacterized protein
MDLLGYFLAILVGISLGTIGSGGSILTVPILVYILKVEPVLATAYSLFIVGSTALVGGIQNAIQKNVDFKTAAIFGIPSIAAVYFTRLIILPFIPDVIATVDGFVFTKSIAVMILFAVVMIMASVTMIRNGKKIHLSNSKIDRNYILIFAEGTLVGVLTGMVGAGGGFLIIPALVLLAKMPMKLAVGTSLLIIAAKSLVGFVGDLQTDALIEWNLLLGFTLASATGIFIGNSFSKKVDGEKLKIWFGWFVLLMGIYIIIKEFYLR